MSLDAEAIYFGSRLIVIVKYLRKYLLLLIRQDPYLLHLLRRLELN